MARGTIAGSMRGALLIYNPKAGRWQAPHHVAAVVKVLGEGGWRVEAEGTSAPGEATEIARAAAGRGVEAVFALGGDGTLREAARGLLGTEVLLGTLPGGTTNVVSQALGLPPHPVRAATALRNASFRPIDVGLCGEEPFLMQASCGLDARIVARLEPHLKRRLGRGEVILKGLAEWWRYSFPEVRLLADGRALAGTLVVVCNLAFYAGPWRLAPGARCDDRRLDLVLLRGAGRAATLSFALDLLRGRHLGRPDVECLEVNEVEIVGPLGVPVQIDGDPLRGAPPLRVRLASERLRLMVPSPRPPGRRKAARVPQADEGKRGDTLATKGGCLADARDDVGRGLGDQTAQAGGDS